MAWASRRRSLLLVAGWALLLAAGGAIASSLRAAAHPPAVEVLGAVEERTDARAADHADVPVVRVRARGCGGLTTGSGVVVNGGRVLTARHVVEGATAVSIDLPSGATTTAEVASFGAEGRDVALLRLATTAGASAVPVADRPAVRGEVVSVFGHPQGGETVQRDGVVIAIVERGRLALDGGRVMTVSVGFEPGVSGGPVVDRSGQLLGIAIGVERNSGTGIAIPVDEIAPLLEGHGEAAAAVCRASS